MKVYAFDVDDTLSCSRGPISDQMLETLRSEGHAVGLCGNWAMFVQSHPSDWWRFVSFLGPLAMTKADFLKHLAEYVPASEYILVGNTSVGHQYDNRPMRSNDDVHASLAGWRFILEAQFASGDR